MFTEQNEMKKNVKMLIPQGCSLGKLMTILIAIRNKGGDAVYVEDEKIKSSTDFSGGLVGTNINFLKSINLVEKDIKKTKLTKIGNEFTESWTRKDENISKLILQIIKESCLVDLSDYIQTNDGIKIEKIFGFIKSQARLSEQKDGRPFSDVPFQGVKTLVKLFEMAGLLTDEQIKESKEYRNAKSQDYKSSIKKNTNKKIPANKRSNTSNQDLEGNLSLPSGIQIPLSSIKNVEFAVMHLNDLLQELKKKDEKEISNTEEIDSTES